MPITVVAQERSAAQVWIEAAEMATAEVAQAALGSDGMVSARANEPPPMLGGAYLQLMGVDEMVHVGLCADGAGLRWMASRFAGPAIADGDIGDAIGELVNMIAGGIKRRLTASRRNLQLGLPLIIHGHLQAGEQQTLSATTIRLANGPSVVLVVLHAPRRHRAPD